ncbi:MAG: hypothetical protein C5B59_18835 [Bacteroidetes bacterium]|nr:MAG: hypothetical protein C5B59_18835 [Bacteroidota bacterium]
MRILFCLLILCASSSLRAEDLNGIWKGTLTQNPGGCYPQYFIELEIRSANNSIEGRAYDYYDTTKFVRLSFEGRYDPQTHRLVLTEDKVLQSNIPGYCVPCIKTYDLVYEKKGNTESLSGEWKGHVVGQSGACPPGKIYLERAVQSTFSNGIFQNDSLARLQESLHIEPRKKDMVRTVVVTSPHIQIQLYDNGEIDNDTITVFINGKLLLYKQMLTDKPLNLDFTAIPGVEYELVMYADNLGLIPPNTALMVVKAGSKKFEVFLSSSEQKSATVKFVYDDR